MRTVVEQAREATGGGTVSNSSMRLVVQRYWRKLADPAGLRDHIQRPKTVSDLKVHHTDSPMDKKLSHSERFMTEVD